MKKTRIPIPLFQREKDRERQQIGNPTLLETTYDQRHLRNATNLREAGSGAKPLRQRTYPQPSDPYAPFEYEHLTPPRARFGNEVRISAAATDVSGYSQGQSNYGYDYYDHPTAQALAGVEHSPQISPIVEAANSDGRSSMRDVSPIRESLPPLNAFPQTPEQPQSRWSPNTASPESTFSQRSTVPVQSKFSPVSTISPQSKRSGRTSIMPQSKFSAHSTPQTNYSPQSTFAPVPRYTGFIDNRRPRPVSFADSLTTVATRATTATTRKPVPHRVASSTAASIMTNATTKALPPPPMDVDPKDRIANLEARMGDLFVQKSNITRIIADLKETKPQNPLLSDIAKRREDEKRLQELEAQLHNIVSEEHEAGVSLSRAWRKREEENPNISSTVLWIHRVTS